MKLFLILLAFVFTLNTRAQDPVYRSAVSAELGGLGLGYSAQYDYLFKRSDNGFYDARIGIGATKFSSMDYYISLPHALTYNFRQLNQFYEGGIGGILANEYTSNFPNNVVTVVTRYYIGPMIGYRSISRSGFQFRIYATWLFYKDGSFPFVGIGFGKAFKKKVRRMTRQ